MESSQQTDQDDDFGNRIDYVPINNSTKVEIKRKRVVRAEATHNPEELPSDELVSKKASDRQIDYERSLRIKAEGLVKMFSARFKKAVHAVRAGNADLVREVINEQVSVDFESIPAELSISIGRKYAEIESASRRLYVLIDAVSAEERKLKELRAAVKDAVKRREELDAEIYSLPSQIALRNRREDERLAHEREKELVALRGKEDGALIKQRQIASFVVNRLIEHAKLKGVELPSPQQCAKEIGLNWFY